MDKIKGLDLIDYAVEKNVDFLAFAVSPWHMLGVRAVLEALMLKHETLNGIIAICKNVNGHYTIEPELYRTMREVEMVYYDSEVQKDSRIWNAIDLRMKKIYSSPQNFYFLMPYEIDIFLYAYYYKKLNYAHITCYIIDEGLGTYLGIKRNKVGKNGKYQCDIKENLRNLLIKRYTYKLKQSYRYNNFSILEWSKENGWVKNEKSVKYYEKVLKKNKVSDFENANIYRDALLINTQPFMGVGIPENNEDVKILLKLCELCKEREIKVVIKPHPGQKDLDRYAELRSFAYFDLRKELSQEEILSSLKEKPRAVVAYSSTTLVTSKLFYDIPAYSLANILLSKKISDAHEKRLNAFISTFKNQVEFVDSLEYIIDRLRAENY